MPRPAQQGTVDCVEFVSEDAGETQAFMSELFGWKFEEKEGYQEATTPGEVSGALSQSEEGERAHALVYLTVRSIDNVTRRAEELGGRVLTPRQGVEGGWWAMIQAPGGVNVGLFESGESFTRPQAKTRRQTRRLARRETRTTAVAGKPRASRRATRAAGPPHAPLQGPRARTKRTRPARKVR